MKPETQRRGERGESLAERYLLRHGYEILERGLRVGRAEVDLVAKKERLLIAVEVKLRSGDGFGTPETFVSEAQQNRVRSAIDNYIHEIDWPGEVRFDVIAILHRGASHELTHFEDAF